MPGRVHAIGTRLGTSPSRSGWTLRLIAGRLGDCGIEPICRVRVPHRQGENFLRLSNLKHGLSEDMRDTAPAENRGGVSWGPSQPYLRLPEQIGCAAIQASLPDGFRSAVSVAFNGASSQLPKPSSRPRCRALPSPNCFSGAAHRMRADGQEYP